MKKLFSRRYRMRRHFAAAFFGIICLFVIILFFFVWLLEYLGVSPYAIHNPLHALIAIAILCLILTSAAFYFLAGKVFRPLEDMSHASRRVAKGDYNVQVQYDGSVEEMEHMVQNFNAMVQELGSVEMMRNDFIANVSHEFKTPLSSVTGYVTLLQDPDLSEEERSEYIRKIFFNIEKLNDLTENILRLSKLEHRAYLEADTTYRLDEQIREVIVLMEPKWNPKQIDFDLDLCEYLYTGQQSLLFQVWINLLSNAIKFSDHGGRITIRMKVRDDNVQVLFSDDGIGMNTETMAHIFDKFYQGDTSRQAQGNGLGLALCKEIVTRCHGRIYVTSKPGQGSVFMVRLPGTTPSEEKEEAADA